MAVFRYDDEELRERLARWVKGCWPDERLLLSSPCEMQRLPAWDEWGHGMMGPVEQAPGFDTPPKLPGVLAATGARLVFNGRRRPGAMLRAAAAIAFAIGLINLFNRGGGLWVFTGAVMAGLLLWIISVITEIGSLHPFALPFDRILRLDPETRRVVATDEDGATYQLHLGDPEDFQRLMRIATGGRADAA